MDMITRTEISACVQYTHEGKSNFINLTTEHP